LGVVGVVDVRSLFDEAYAGSAPVFGLRPDLAFERMVLANDLHGKALDLGCGDGRNSLFLARYGFSVDAFDVSQPAVEKLNQTARRSGLKITAEVVDLRDLVTPPDHYDLVVADTVFCHLQSSELHDLTSRIVASLRPGGFLYVSVFSDCDPRLSEFAPLVKSWFSPAEFRRLFSGLDIGRCEEFPVLDRRHGPVHPHVLLRLIAQRRTTSS
jgi:cyclopropane fatty-acyl-phospholipid synthase-like methyltransferase